jgi:tetratricopeptide (TPR) repeat protein
MASLPTNLIIGGVNSMLLHSTQRFLMGLLLASLSFLASGPALAQDSGADPAAALLQQGNAALASQRYEDAVKAFKKANQLRHDSCGDCYFDLAIAQMKIGEFDDALKSCDKAISCAPNDLIRTSSHTLKGNILSGMGTDSKKLKQAESEYRAALQLDPKSAMTHFHLGVVLLRQSQESEGVGELNTYLKLAPDGADANLARKLIADPKRAGDTLAPGFDVKTLQGDEISLDQLSGKIVVMDFWATWCGPCRESVPELKALIKKYPSSKLALISFSADNDQQAWRAFISSHGMEWPQYWDSDGRIRKNFGVNAFPTYLVIDQEGFIRERIVGLNPQLSVVGRLKDTLQAMLPAE